VNYRYHNAVSHTFNIAFLYNIHKNLRPISFTEIYKRSPAGGDRR
jgi:hypothetical protein